MPNNVLKISKKSAYKLAKDGLEVAFFLDEQPTDIYLTYTDVPAPYTTEPFVLQDADIVNTGLVTYVPADGTYPIRKDRKMFPR